jgi:two-component system, cell cycle sensor histidine kinase and response regulator CckA
MVTVMAISGFLDRIGGDEKGDVHTPLWIGVVGDPMDACGRLSSTHYRRLTKYPMPGSLEASWAFNLKTFPFLELCRPALRFLWSAAAMIAVVPAWGQIEDASPAERKSDRLRGTLRVGAATDSYPYSFRADDGTLKGYSVDVLDAVARHMNLKIERVPATGQEVPARFIAGEYDLLQVYGRVPEREAIADFSIPFLELQGALFVRTNEKQIDVVEDLKGREVIIVGVGSVGERFIRQELEGTHVIQVSSVEDGARLLAAGRHDAMFVSKLSMLSVIEREKIRGIRLLASIDGFDVRHCLAVHKGDAELLARLNEGLALLHRTGELNQIYQRWFGQLDGPVFTREEVILYVATALAVGLFAAVYGLLRQRALRKRISGQARELAESQAILAEAQQIAHVGHWHFYVHNRKVHCSEEALRIFGRNPAEGPPSYYRVLAMIDKADRPAAHRTLTDALGKGTISDMVLTLHLRGGVRKFVHANVRTVCDQSGAVTELFGTIQDITRQKTTDEDLRTREQLLRALYDNVPSAMGVVEAAGESFRFISANPGTARLLGLPPSPPLAGRVLAELPLAPAVLEFWSGWFHRAHDGATVLRTEQQLESTRRHYAIALVPLGRALGGQAQLCFLVEDVTDRIQMDAEIAQGRKLRAVGELVGGIAHEFNNLLTPILLKTDLLAAEHRADAGLIQELGTIKRAGQRGADLTKRLLAFGRRSESRFEDVHVHALVQANFELLRPTIDRRIQFQVTVSEKLPPLFLSPSDVHQVILNLLLNARDTLVEKLDRAPSGDYVARIWVEAAEFGPEAREPASWETARRPRGWIRLTVRDNGMGMPRAVLERIFEPFYTTKEVGKGTGLGLATAWRLVNNLGGKISVESSLGGGSAFEVWLPIFNNDAVVEASRPVAATPGNTVLKILLIEDDELVAKTVAASLRQQKHHVVHYAHGTAAWEHIAEQHGEYDLFLLDLDLPGLSGLEILRRMRARRFPSRILVASGRLEETQLRELRQLKADGVLEKPFTPQTLHLAVQGQRGDPVHYVA